MGGDRSGEDSRGGATGVRAMRAGGTSQDNGTDLPKAMNAFWAEPSLRTISLSRRVRFERYRSIVPGILLFGCEIWPFSKSLLQRLRQFEGGLLRIVARIS